ncbi:LytR/AlgR family response regulator transcription factor [Lacrimispora amygdalina]|uniref:LytR/AlgR family response regulator transcription factor n=1 Tax=Lacrimispora amygdalina TaxID=253257 RepID=UPI000BE22212|nr:LytTR family DNA-binding domain-containing protein [Lacrimispora amygdalina]
MINIAICDDDNLFSGQLDTFLHVISKNEWKNIETEIFEDGQELADYVTKGEKYDLIFMDIEMKVEDGLSAAKRIRKIDKNVLIVYVTSHEIYMKQSFDMRPFRFLTKPIDNEILKKCFFEACEEIETNNYYFKFRYQRINWKIPVKDILYFESQKRKVRIITQNGYYIMYEKMNEIEKMITKEKINFLRVHQSFLVNYRHIEGLAYDRIIMDNGQIISISEDRRKIVSEEYCMIGDDLDVN